jgi:hypothetical protein
MTTSRAAGGCRAANGRSWERQHRLNKAGHLVACGFDYMRALSYKEAVAALVARGILRGIRVQ